MKNLLSFLMIAGCLFPAAALASAFEEHTGWQKEPVLETQKGVSVGRSVLEMGTGVRFLSSDTYFNSDGKMGLAPLKFTVTTMDLFARFGFTENWTFFGNVPIVWSTLEGAARARSAEGDVGDVEIGALYQFLRQSDPTLSMGLGMRWKLPTGQEAVGGQRFNITGTGTTDVELFYNGRYQLMRNLAVGWATGYNLRFPSAVQYLSDRNTSITNAFLDLGDELFLRADLTGAIDVVALQITAEFRYRFPTEVGMPEFRAETIRWQNPRTGERIEEEWLLYNGASYAEWGVHQNLDPTQDLVSNAGYLFTLTPRVVVRPVDWMDISLFARLHLAGQNSIFLTDKDQDNSSFDNFMPMQTLGKAVGSAFVLGEVGTYATFRW